MIEHAKEVADELAKLLAETYTAYLKTHNYHWNVTGPMFHGLHTMFEVQYTELALAVDSIAERIRALGSFAPGSYAAFARLSEVKDDETVPPAATMLANLASDHRLIAERANKVMKLAAKHEDEGTAALASARIEIHEKTAWMLSAHLE
ncbi:Dps family protein [Alcanivorax sp. 1008]|uniref:Dps family protein n=1 Tax=Alcanivorax sp. 1008 TaxID=2816853 RepID=UPI001D70CBF3|nr:Dps family protein [Alcanivorax sp. 1008]MCC1496026.1 DNA starvation/stationary phase protection protein [Alcanivorax sp. 1008]